MYRILTVQRLETNFVFKRILLNSTYNTRYAISYQYLAQSAIETMFYRQLRCNMLFFKKKRVLIFLEKIDIKGMADKFYMHKYLTLTFYAL